MGIFDWSNIDFVVMIFVLDENMFFVGKIVKEYVLNYKIYFLGKFLGIIMLNLI